MIKNVIFDLGNVLINFTPLEYLKSLGYDDIKAKELFDATIGDQIWIDMDAGKYMEKEEYLKAYKDKYPNLYPDIELFLNGPWMDNLIYPIKENQVLIDIVKEKGLKYYILSNYPNDSFRYTYNKCEFIRNADGMVISSHVKISKPDPKIYNLLLDKYNLNPKECIFIDDRKDNVDTAISLGIKGIVYKDLQTTKQELLDALD